MAVDRETAAALSRVEERVRPWWAQGWVVVKGITFPAANTRLDVAHGLSAIPEGFTVLWSDGPVYAAPGQIWTDSVAYLQTNAANVHADVVFYRLRQE